MNRSLIFLGAAALAWSAAPTPASAQGLLDIGRVILGLPAEPKEPLDYRERPPLIVPPNTTQLRPPADPVAPDQRRANWPQDPDVIARRQALENARRPADMSSVTSREPGATRRLTLEEIRAGRVAGGETRPDNSMSMGPNRSGVEGNHRIFEGLAALREMDRRDAANRSPELARQEPRREFLTDPPSGLRRPADNAAFRATREGQVGARQEPSPFDIFREGPNTR